MASHILHFLPNAPCVPTKISHFKCSLAHSRPSTQKSYSKNFLHRRNVLVYARNLHNGNSNHRIWREKGALFRPSCFGSESDQDIIDQSSEILEQRDVQTLEYKENISNGNGRVTVEEEQIETHLVYTAKDEEVEVKSAEGFRFRENCVSTWQQMKEVMMFAGPALGIWICGPLMSLIDTAVIGQSSSLELAALGPATVVCDYLGYVFMFLSIATSNMIATSLAQQGISRETF